MRSDAGVKSSIVLDAGTEARAHYCSHTLSKGYSSPQQPLKTKVEANSNSPVPLMTEDEGCSPHAPYRGLVCLGLVLCHWMSFTDLLILYQHAEYSHTYTLKIKFFYSPS